MSYDKEIEQIERYLNNEMSETERKGFDQTFDQNEELIEEFERRQTAHHALDYLVAKNLKAQLEELEQEDKVIAINRNRKRRMIILSVAASVLLVVSSYFFLLPQDDFSQAELALAYYELPDLADRGTNTTEQSIDNAVSALQNQEYQNAIDVLEAITDDSDFYIRSRYYLGHAYYGSGQYDQAQESFSIVSASNDIRLIEEAQWYELLSCLAQDSECSALLEKITTDKEHSYYTQTIEISKKIK
ncbi:MAG: hypothetical protein AAFO07_19525 [Bacteroidota bacterium]